MAEYDKTCEYCGNYYTAFRRDSKCCSKTCTDALWYSSNKRRHHANAERSRRRTRQTRKEIG